MSDGTPVDRPAREPDALQRCLTAWTALLARHRAALTLVLLVIAATFTAASRGIRWQPDVLAFFSAQSAEVRSMQAAAGTPGLATQLRIDLHGKPGISDDTVRAAASALARTLETADEGPVWSGIDAAAMARAYAGLVEQAPALLDDTQRAQALRRATPEYLAERFAAVRQRLADPDGEIQLRRLAADPLDLSEFITAKLQDLGPGAREDASSAGTRVTMEEGLLLARSGMGLHAMVVLSPRSAPSDQQAARRTLAKVNAAVTSVARDFPGIECWVVGAHRGYVENARRIQADVAVVSVLGTLAVAGAIFGYFYRRRASLGEAIGTGLGPVLLCMVPQGIGIGMALGLAGMIQAELPLILLGFVGLLCGSTTDYGIQIIAECRRRVGERLARGLPAWDVALPAGAARALLGPISMSVITSALAFASLGLSASPGLRALGLFVSLASICIWVVTFFILPAYVTQAIGAVAAPTLLLPAGRSQRWRRPLLVAFIAVSAWLGWHALHVRFNSDPRALDGSSAALQEQEAAFYRVWGDLRNRAVVLVRGRDAQEALERASAVRDYLADQQRDGLLAAINSPAGADGILPAQRAVNHRLAAWNSHWQEPQRRALSEALAAAAQANGMRPDPFSAYAQRLAAVAEIPADVRLRHSPAMLFPGFIQQDADGITLAMLVQMRNDRSLRMAAAWGPELRLRFAHWQPAALSILSGNLLVFDATERARAEGERFAPWCLLGILIPLWIFFRRLRSAWLAMLCLLVGFVWVLGSAQVLGSIQGMQGGLNLLSLVPVLFTLGVVIDYGIYASTATPREHPARSSATFLCAFSTILGSSALIAAQHPVMRWLGITLVAGILGGYLTSVLIVGPLARARFIRPPAASRIRWFPAAGRLALRAALLLLTLLLALPPVVDALLSRQRPANLPPPPATLPPLVQTRPRTYTAGDSWLRWRADPHSPNAGLWELLLAGSPEERGYATAKLAGPIDLRIESEMLDQLDRFLPQVWSRWLLLRAVSANLATLPAHIPPEHQQEIYFTARHHPDVHAYLAPTYPRILSYHALHDISQMLIDNPLIVPAAPATFACTGVVSLPDYTGPQGRLLLGRIFDFEGGESFGRQKSITYLIPPPGEGIPFAHIAWPGLSGAVTGINREKIALFINAAATTDFQRIGTPTILMARQVLQHARSLEEARQIIAKTQTFVSDILVLADGKTGQACVIEKSPSRWGTYDVRHSLVVTNHLLSPAFEHDPVNRSRQEEGTTLQRYARARQLLDRLEGRVTPDALAALLRDKRGLDDKSIGLGNRNAIDALIACHAVVMDVTDGTLWVAAWPHAGGTFIGVDIMAMLDRGAGLAEIDAEMPPLSGGQDSMMAFGPDGLSPWARVLESRQAATQAGLALARGDAPAALASADEVIRLNPDFFHGHELRGRALLLQGDASAARLALRRALSLDPPYRKRRSDLEGLIRQCDTHGK